MTRRSSPAPGQYDLFGDIERAEQEAADRTQTRAEAEAAWQARFERVEMDAPWHPAGSVLGWVCPACKTVESSEFLLGNNHGYHLHWPGSAPYRAEFGATCTKLELQAAHAAYDARRAMIRHLAAQGMDDEQIAGRIGAWSASTVAGYRKDDEKATRLAARAAKGETVTVGHGSDCPCAYCEGPCGCPSCQAFRGNR